MSGAGLGVKIGLEIHVQLTESATKLFCDCKANYRGMPPNTNVCPVCLGLPGALPVPRRDPLRRAAAVAMYLNCAMPEQMVFSRKHYFYPDMPKNYQITQYQGGGGAPICLRGRLDFYDPDVDAWRSVTIRRVNVEEDPGRTEYEGSITSSEYAYVDYNRSGVPLVEIVTEPEIGSPREARRLVEYLLLALSYMSVTNPKLEGSFRVDANVSVAGGERVEVKNIGSTVDLERALRYEVFRQSRIVAQGGAVRRETRAWDPVRRVTKPLRAKEYEEEYLYFPDPDIPSVSLAELVKEAAPLLAVTPDKLMTEMVKLGVPQRMAWSLVVTKPSARLFLRAVSIGSEPRLTARLLAIDLKGLIKKLGKDPDDEGSWPSPELVRDLVGLVVSGRYSYDEVKYKVLPAVAANPKADVLSLLPPRVSDVDSIVSEVLRSEPKAVKDYLSGKSEALDYLVGAVLKRAGGSVDPRVVREAIARRLAALALDERPQGT